MGQPVYQINQERHSVCAQNRTVVITVRTVSPWLQRYVLSMLPIKITSSIMHNNCIKLAIYNSFNLAMHRICALIAQIVTYIT